MSSFLRQAVLKSLGGMKRGCLRVELPEGETLTFGETAEGRDQDVPSAAETGAAVIRVRREAFFSQCVLAGDIGFAEAYIGGDWDTPDLTAVVAWFILNVEASPALSGSRRGRAAALNLLRLANRVRHQLHPNSRASAPANIRAHYDLSNDFFGLFLDPSMMYSCAKWNPPALSLEAAQRAKNDALCRKLRLTPGDHVLEIGSGWGGWSIQAAQTYGCKVTTITLSREQQDLARQRIGAAGLADRVKVELRDYRDLAGRFDKLVSIEMMEAIGHRYLPEFCAVIGRTLKPDGLAALQFITCPDARYGEFRRGVDFIQKHIFPGSLLLSLNRVNELLARAAGFVLHDAEDMGLDYARTLREWRGNFEARLDAVRQLGFDERFIRKWRYYFSYCEAAFARRNISVVQAVYTRPNNLSF